MVELNMFIDKVERLYIERALLYSKYLLYDNVRCMMNNDAYYNIRKNGIPEEIIYILNQIFNGACACRLELNNRTIYGRIPIENLNYLDRWSNVIEHDIKSETIKYGYNAYLWTCSNYLRISYVKYDNGIKLENIYISKDNMMEFEKKIHDYIDNMY